MRMFSTRISPPPPFIDTPGTPAVPWARWIRLFETFILVSGATELSAQRRRALLLHCLGTEGQRIFDALPQSALQTKLEQPSIAAVSTSHAAVVTEITATAGTQLRVAAVSTSYAAAVTETATTAGTQTLPYDGTADAPRLPDEYDVAPEMLTRHFAASCNIRLQRHRFRERRQLQGEPITDFAIALPNLAALCNFATQADENMCEQFVAGITCPRLRERLLLEGDKLTFNHAVQIHFCVSGHNANPRPSPIQCTEFSSSYRTI